MSYPNSISMRSFREYSKSKTVRTLPKTDNIILMWSSGVHHRSPTVVSKPWFRAGPVWLGVRWTLASSPMSLSGLDQDLW